jgi:hypothetical protein
MPIPKPYLYGGIIAVGAGGLIAYSMYEKKKQAQAAAQAALQQQQQNNMQQYGYGSGGSTYGYAATEIPYGYGAFTYAPSDPYGYGVYGAGTGEPPAPLTATTNAQWVQAAVTALSQQGYTGSQVLAALGLYVTGQPLSASQEQIVTAAIGAEGYPPIPGTSGYPPAMNAGSTSTGNNPGGNSVTVPSVTGMGFGQAYNTLVNAGLKSSPGQGKVNANYKVTAQNPAAGTLVASGTTVSLTTKS